MVFSKRVPLNRVSALRTRQRQKVKVFLFSVCKILVVDGFGLTERLCHVRRISPRFSREHTLRDAKIQKFQNSLDKKFKVVHK